MFMQRPRLGDVVARYSVARGAQSHNNLGEASVAKRNHLAFVMCCAGGLLWNKTCGSSFGYSFINSRNYNFYLFSFCCATNFS